MVTDRHELLLSVLADNGPTVHCAD